MQRFVLGVVAGVCAVLSVGLSACGDDQPGPLHGGEAGDAGEGPSAGRGGSSGTGGSGGSDDGGGAGAPSTGGEGQGGARGGAGGRGGSSGSSGSGGSGGITGSGGSAQGGVGGNEGGAGGDGNEPDQLTICLRLMRAGSLAIDTTLAYETALIADCRVNWTTTLYFDSSIGLNVRDEFLNNLIVWNLALWGCNPTAPTDFALIYEPAPLTSADARALIDIYVETATGLLAMSPPEIAEMRALLERLSQPLIDRMSDEYSNPDCAGGAGGAGG